MNLESPAAIADHIKADLSDEVIVLDALGEAEVLYRNGGQRLGYIIRDVVLDVGVHNDRVIQTGPVLSLVWTG